MHPKQTHNDGVLLIPIQLANRGGCGPDPCDGYSKVEYMIGVKRNTKAYADKAQARRAKAKRNN